jgi:hypothetical protein
VDLQELDSATEPGRLSLEMGSPVGDRAGPYLGGDDRLVAAAGDRGTQHGLGAAVHRRAVDDAQTEVERSGDHRVGDVLPVRRKVEDAPGPQAHHGNRDPVAAERPGQHVEAIGALGAVAARPIRRPAATWG